MSEVLAEITKCQLVADLEALLFVASGPVSPAQLAAILNTSLEQVEQGLVDLAVSFEAEHGLRLQRHAGKVQMTTAPEMAGLVERFLGLEATTRLSRAGLETLAIVAYQQPVTRPQIDAIRGVNSDGVLKSLLTKGLIQEGGRGDGPGRPIMYTTTPEFLQYFGLCCLEEMPPYEPAGELLNSQTGPREILKD